MGRVESLLVLLVFFLLIFVIKSFFIVYYMVNRQIPPQGTQLLPLFQKGDQNHLFSALLSPSSLLGSQVHGETREVSRQSLSIQDFQESAIVGQCSLVLPDH